MIYDSTKNLRKKIWRKVSWKIVEFHKIKGCVQKVILEKKFSKSEPIQCYSEWFGACTKITVIKFLSAVRLVILYFDNFILKK